MNDATKTPGQVAFEKYHGAPMWAAADSYIHQVWESVAAAVIAHHEQTRPLPEATIVPNPSAEFNASLHDFEAGRTVPLDVALTTPPPPGETPTPRTDAHEQRLQEFRNATRNFQPDEARRAAAMADVPPSWDDFARTLERELTAANVRLASMPSTMTHMEQLQDLRDRLVASEARVAAAQAAVRELCGALRQLYDHCNSATREQQTKQWERAMDVTHAALAKHAPKKEASEP
jgi:hypothetical protein